jgi:hypothetical protein
VASFTTTGLSSIISTRIPFAISQSSFIYVKPSLKSNPIGIFSAFSSE